MGLFNRWRRFTLREIALEMDFEKSKTVRKSKAHWLPENSNTGVLLADSTANKGKTFMVRADC